MSTALECPILIAQHLFDFLIQNVDMLKTTGALSLAHNASSRIIQWPNEHFLDIAKTKYLFETDEIIAVAGFARFGIIARNSMKFTQIKYNSSWGTVFRKQNGRTACGTASSLVLVNQILPFALNAMNTKHPPDSLKEDNDFENDSFQVQSNNCVSNLNIERNFTDRDDVFHQTPT